MKVRIKLMRVFDGNWHTIKYELVSKTDDMFLKYFFNTGGFEAVAIWKVKLKQ
jgi:hypothetical protein